MLSYNTYIVIIIHYQVPYRHRFFKLVDTFLRSTHVQTYLVASFAKRLARLALTAPSGAAAFVIALIFNLLNTHRACRFASGRVGYRGKLFGGVRSCFRDC